MCMHSGQPCNALSACQQSCTFALTSTITAMLRSSRNRSKLFNSWRRLRFSIVAPLFKHHPKNRLKVAVSRFRVAVRHQADKQMRLACIIGGSCYKYHFCHNKTRLLLLATKSIFVATKLLALSRQTHVCRNKTCLLSRQSMLVTTKL